LLADLDTAGTSVQIELSLSILIKKKSSILMFEGHGSLGFAGFLVVLRDQIVLTLFSAGERLDVDYRRSIIIVEKEGFFEVLAMLIALRIAVCTCACFQARSMNFV